MFSTDDGQLMSTAFEVFSLTSVNCFLFAAVNIFLNVFSKFHHKKHFFARIFVEYLAIFVPFILAVTVCSEYSLLASPLLFAFSVFGFIVCLLHVSNYSWNPSLPVIIKSEDFIVPEVSRLYANLMICVCVTILAVDFRIFPKRFAKTSLYGISLMDVGVGCFIAINAVLSYDVRKPLQFMSKMERLKNIFASCLPLLCLGFQRLAVVKGIDYHQEIIEYGVHWNFFFTLSFTKMFSSFLCCFVRRADVILILAIIVGVLHQVSLSCGLSRFIQNDNREGIIAANKEGIISLPGYVSLYLLFVAIGKYWRTVIFRENNADYVSSFVIEMPFVVVFTGFLTVLSHLLIEFVSRREANLAYVCWITTLVVYLALVEHLYSLAIIILIRLGVMDKQSPLLSGQSVVCAAVAKNPLIIFLIANILTGIINITFHTTSIGTRPSLFILFVYTFILCVTAVFLYIKNIKLRIPTNINIVNFLSFE